MRKIFLTAIYFFTVFVFTVFAYAQNHSFKNPTLILFYSPDCHQCIKIKNELMPNIEKKFKGRINVEYRDITEIENYKLLLSLQEKYKVKIENVWPVIYFEGQFLNGQGKVRERLQALISHALRNIPVRKKGGLPAIDLLARFKSFSPFVIVSAGLIDGINPCAFTVIVFFISFLALQGYKKRDIIVIGLSFIFAVCLTYILIGIGLFGFLYRLKGFWLVTRVVNLGIGIFSIVLGIFTLYDFFKFKKTGQTEGLVLQLPQVVKNQIHSVIGIHYRHPKVVKEGAMVERNILKLLLSALITGFLVSILEAVCTGQTYLPTITFILKSSNLKLQALGYLALYNLMFIMPLLAIFLLALLGVTSEQFSRVLKKHLLTLKILMAVLFFSLGIFLILRA